MELAELLTHDEGKENRPLLKNLNAVVESVRQGRAYAPLTVVDGIDIALETAWFRELQATLDTYGFDLHADGRRGESGLSYVFDITDREGTHRMAMVTTYEFVKFMEYTNPAWSVDPFTFFDSLGRRKRQA